MGIGVPGVIGEGGVEACPRYPCMVLGEVFKPLNMVVEEGSMSLAIQESTTQI